MASVLKPCDVVIDYLADALLPVFNEWRAAGGIEPAPLRAGPPITAEEAKAAADEYWTLEALWSEQTAAEVAEWMKARAVVPARKVKGRPKLVPSPDTITPTTPLRLDIAAQIAFPDGSVGVSGLRREIDRGNLRAEMIAGKLFTTLADIKTMRERCAVPTKARESSSENHADRENPIDGSSSTAMPADVASNAAQAHLRQTAQRLRASGRTPKKPSPTTSDESTSRNSAAVIRLKSE
jgi:hypothetical protein